MAEHADRDGPLNKLRVLDVGQLIAGPMAATLLADYGADVVKVEAPGQGDSLRKLAPFKDGVPLWWKVNARNKRCIALDLKASNDLLLFYELVKVADVVIENYSVGTARDLHIDYDTLRALNPGIIMLSISGYGQTGPYAHRRAFGRTAEAFSGMAYTTGYADRPPAHSGFPVADAVSGVMGATAVLAALYERDRNGTREGQFIDLALYETPFRLMEFVAIQFDQLGTITERTDTGGGNNYVYPVGTWLTKDGKWASFTGSTEQIVARLFVALGRADLRADPRFATNAARLEHRHELEPIIATWMRARDIAEIVDTFEKHDLAIAPYLTIADIFCDPQYAARENIIQLPDEDLGSVRMQGVVPIFGRTPGRVRYPGRVRIGADQESVIADWLGPPAEPSA